MKLVKYIALMPLLCAAFAVQPAKAVAITPTFPSTLNVGNSDLTGNGFNPPYGTVDVSLTGQVATITFTAAAGYEFGDGGAADVNVNSTNFTANIGSVTESPGSSLFDSFSSGNADGFGDFNLKLNNKDFSVGFTTISFTVTNNNLLSPWLTTSDVLAFNASGFDAAAHIRSTVNNPTGITGFAGEGFGTPSTPDSGTTAMLLGGALAGLGLVRRYLKR
jgi:VPDSG-CTERM motif